MNEINAELALDRIEQKFERLRERLALVEAERDAARAEVEDRKAEAARAQEALRYVMNGLPANDAVWAAYGNADSARAWLAQQRREAAADENDRWANGWWDMKEDMTASVFYARAAALRAVEVGDE